MMVELQFVICSESARLGSLIIYREIDIVIEFALGIPTRADIVFLYSESRTGDPRI